jgi:hypothetical protein
MDKISNAVKQNIVVQKGLPTLIYTINNYDLGAIKLKEEFVVIQKEIKYKLLAFKKHSFILYEKMHGKHNR